MGVFEDTIQNELERRKPTPPIDLRAVMAKAAIDDQRKYSETYHDEHNRLFRQALTKAAAYLMKCGRPVQPHYIGLPAYQEHHSIMRTSYEKVGYQWKKQDARGWQLSFSEQKGNEIREQRAFLREDGEAIILGGDDTIDLRAAPDNVRPHEALHEVDGEMYAAAQSWRRYVTPVEDVAGGFVVRDGALMRGEDLRGYDTAGTIGYRSFEEDMAKLAMGGTFPALYQ